MAGENSRYLLMWDAEDLQRLPLLSVAKFCEITGLSDHIRDLLEDGGFSTSWALFEAGESDLEKAGFKAGHIAELRRALKQFAAGHSVHPNRRVAGSIWPGGNTDGVPLSSVAEFCQITSLSDHIRNLLDDCGFSTSWALFEAVESDLERAGFKAEYIAELRTALKQFVQLHPPDFSVNHDESISGLTDESLPVLMWDAGDLRGLPLLSVAELCQVNDLSDHICDRLQECGFFTSGALFEAVESGLERARFKAGHIAELRRALNQFAAGHSVHPNQRVAGSIWPGGNTDGVPLSSVAEFCQITSLSDHIRDLLDECGFSTSDALFEAVESDLEKAGFKFGHIAELRRALNEFAARYSVYPNPRAGAIWAGGYTTRLPLLPLNEFGLIVRLSDHICALLKDCGFSTSGALFEVVQSDLEKAEFKVGYIMELRKALEEFAARYSVYPNPRAGAMWAGGNTSRLPLLPMAEFCLITSLSNHICVLLEDCGFSTSRALFEAVQSDLEKVGFQVGHIIELRRALKQFAARHSMYPNPRAGAIWAGGDTDRLPLLPVAEFCLITGLSNHIRKLLEDCDFSTSGALFEAVESDLEKAGFKVGDITGLRRALQQVTGERF
ncbi:hypothetical protein FB451DRAFT_719812 [Mycena latifolia]|nr:hypothetical protein FB451DRAFT_719812 [Mycena latifolia]